MKQSDRARTFLRQIHLFPLSWLSLSRGKRLLIVTLSYWLGVAGLWFLFPRVHNGASMFLPIVSACWLFRYRGMLISLVLNGIAFQLTYFFLLRGMLPDQAFVEGGVLGFGTSLGLGLVICWLRTGVDLVQVARQQALAAEQERLLHCLLLQLGSKGRLWFRHDLLLFKYCLSTFYHSIKLGEDHFRYRIAACCPEPVSAAMRGNAREKQSAREKERVVTLIATGLLYTPCERHAFCP